MENILLVFESNTSGIEVGIDALEKLGKVDKDTSAQFTKTNEVLKDRNKTLGDTSNVAKFADGMKKVQQANVGAFGTQVIKDYQKAGVDGIAAVVAQIKKLQDEKTALNNSSLKADDIKLYNVALASLEKQLTGVQAELQSLQGGGSSLAPLIADEKAAEAEANKLTKSLSDLRTTLSAKQTQLINETDVEKIAQYKQDIVGLESEIEKIGNIGKTGFDKFGNALKGADEPTRSFKSKLQEVRNELEELRESGGTFSQKYQKSFSELNDDAAHLQSQIEATFGTIKQLSSNTQNIDATVEAVSGMAAAFQIAAGATALFGGSDQELQKTLVKLNAVMAITAGLQQVSSFLTGNSILKLKAETIAQQFLNFIRTGSIKLEKESIDASNANAVALEKEATAHESNAAAIEVENAAKESGASAGTGTPAEDASATEPVIEAQENLAAANELVESTTASLNEVKKTATAVTAKQAVAVEVETGAEVENAEATGASSLKLVIISALRKSYNFILTGSFKAQTQATLATEGGTVASEVQTTALEAQTGATVGATVATEGASIAMQIFRGALLATGIGAIVILLVALYSAFEEFTSNADEAAAAQNKLNDALSQAGAYLDAEVTGIQDANKRIIASMKERNVSDNDISKQEISNTLLVQNAKKQALVDLNKTLDDTKTINNLSGEDYKKLTDKQLDLMGQIQAGETELVEKRSDLEISYYQQSLKNFQAYADARAVIASEDVNNIKGQLSANIADARATADVQLADANLTAGERYKIEVDLQKKIQDFNQQYRVAVLTNEKNLIDARAAMDAQGSQEEFFSRIAQLNIQYDLDIANAKKSTSAIAKIEADYYKAKAELAKQYDFEVAQNALNTQAQTAQDNITNLQLQNVSENNQKMIAAKEKLIDIQANLEVLSVNNSEHNEELRAAKIKAIYDKQLLDKQILEKQKAQAEIDSEKQKATDSYNIQSSILSALSNQVGAYGTARKNVDDAIYQNTLKNIAAQKKTLKDELDAQLKTQEQYDAGLRDLSTQTTELELSNEEAKYARKIALAEAAAQEIEKVEQAYFQGQQNRLEAEKQSNQDLFDKKLITQNEFNKRQKNIQKEESALKKEQAIFEILIDFGKELFKIQAAAALQAALQNPVGVAAALSQIPFLIATEGISLALVASAKYKKGGYTGDKGVDDEVGIVHGQEYVINAKATKKYKPLLQAINNMQYDSFIETNSFNNDLTNNYSFNKELVLPQVNFDVSNYKIPEFSVSVPDVRMVEVSEEMIRSSYGSRHQPINYDLLADKISDSLVKKQGKMEDVPHSDINIDEKGITAFLRKKNLEIEFANKYYSSRRGK